MTRSSADDDTNFREILSSHEAFSADPTPVNSPIRRKKNSTDDLNNNKLELTRSLSIEEIDLKETLVTAKSWKSEFLQRGGFVHLLKVFFNRSRVALNITTADAHDNVSSEESSLQNLANGLLLKLVRTFLLAAMSSGGTNYHDIAELVRRRSSENKSFLINTTPNATVQELQESYSNGSDKMISRDLQTLFDQTFSMPSSPSNLQELMYKSGISPKISALVNRFRHNATTWRRFFIVGPSD